MNPNSDIGHTKTAMKNKQRPSELQPEGLQSVTGCRLTRKTFVRHLLIYSDSSRNKVLYKKYSKENF